MRDIVTVECFRHTSVLNHKQICYGWDDVDYDTTSPDVVQYFNHLAQILPSDPETTVWLSSGSPRAHGTAQAVWNSVAGKKVPEIIINEDFIEQNFGAMVGHPRLGIADHPDFKKYFADKLNNPPPGGGESLKMFSGRVGGGLNGLCEKLPMSKKDAVIFAHKGTIYAAISHVTGQSIIDVMKLRIKVPYLARLEIQYDRAKKIWLPDYKLDGGLPERHLGLD